MKVLITGGLGHIGSAILRSNAGVEITVFDNLSNQRYPSLFELKRKVTFIQGDIRNNSILHRACEGQDVILHLAAVTDAATSKNQPRKVNSVNVTGTKNVCKAAIEHDCKLVYPSTTSVYGQAEGVVNESSVVNPQSPYASTKLAGERVVSTYQNEEGLRAIILRLGTIHGISYGMRFHTVVNKFCWQAAMGLPLTVWETAMDQKRPYLALEDAIRAFVTVIKKNRFRGDIYNVVTNNHKLLFIVDTIKKFVPTIEVELVQSEIMNQLSYNVSSEKFERTFKFEFMGDVVDDIKKTLEILGAL